MKISVEIAAQLLYLDENKNPFLSFNANLYYYHLKTNDHTY